MDTRNTDIRELIAREDRLHLPNPAIQTLHLHRDERQIKLPVATEEVDKLFHLTEQDGLARAIGTRVWSIDFVIHNTLISARAEVMAGVAEIQQWIKNEEIVRVVGAGRALLAAAIPANRLAHAGARVYVQHDIVPLPNTRKGGAILAASASGKTKSVLELLDTVRRRNRSIRILGIASNSAQEFRNLCDIFIGIDETQNPYPNPLRALADTGEYVISELLDAMVVAAAKRIGLTDENFREGHEDLGDTGPYLPRGAE